MTALLCLLAAAAVVFVTGTARAIRRQRRERDQLRARAQLRSSIHAARLAAEHAHANRRND